MIPHADFFGSSVGFIGKDHCWRKSINLLPRQKVDDTHKFHFDKNGVKGTVHPKIKNTYSIYPVELFISLDSVGVSCLGDDSVT